MTMTRKHFEAVAEPIAFEMAIINNGMADLNKEHPQEKALYDTYSIRSAVLHDVASALAKNFASLNSRFNRTTFMNACGFDH